MKVHEVGHDYLAPQRSQYGTDGAYSVPPAKGPGKPPVEQTQGNKGNARGPAVEVSLSPEAQAILAGSSSATGRSALSPAQRARQFIADNLTAHPELADIPFGKVVSVLARGGDPRSLFDSIVSAQQGDSAAAPETTGGSAASAPAAPANPLQELLEPVDPLASPSDGSAA